MAGNVVQDALVAGSHVVCLNDRGAVSVFEVNPGDPDRPVSRVDLNRTGVPLIEIVSEETGVNFIVDPRVRGEVNVVSGQPIRRGELYDLFLAVLKSYGFAAVTGSGGSIMASTSPAST